MDKVPGYERSARDSGQQTGIASLLFAATLQYQDRRGRALGVNEYCAPWSWVVTLDYKDARQESVILPTTPEISAPAWWFAHTFGVLRKLGDDRWIEEPCDAFYPSSLISRL